MGNVSGREEGSDNSQSGVEGGGAGGGGGAVQDGMADQDPAGGEFMGRSPPPSPRTSQSPLMFRPQVRYILFICCGFSLFHLIVSVHIN